MFVEGGNEVEADPLTIKGLIAWLEQQPADATYRYDHCDDCLLYQYFNAVMGDIESVGPGYIRHRDGRSEPLPEGFEEIAAGLDYKNYHTFGQALAIAKAK